MANGADTGGSRAEAGGAAGAAGSNDAAGSSGAPNEPVVEDSCGDPPVESVPFTQAALRGAAVDCAIWQFCRFESSAVVLDTRLRAYAEEPVERTLAAAREAWKTAIERWSQVELFQFGPLASNSQSAGRDVYQGKGLRDPIYGWPSVARCRVEEQLVSQRFLEGMSGVPNAGRGLYALEYLLFHAGVDTACDASSTVAAGWNGLSPDELASRKLAYATSVSADVLERARALGVAYRPGEGDFRSVFVGTSGYSTQQEAMNVLAWALFYVDRELKDWKLGVPAGYVATSPVRELETPFAGIGSELLRANLLGFRSLFQGCGSNGEGLGFDDWLVEAGHAELANELIAAWNDALAAVEAFPEFPAASREEIQALHAVVKRLTDLLKTEFFGAGSPLGLQLPAGMEGDTD
jgi:predicted lipoprotein